MYMLCKQRVYFMHTIVYFNSVLAFQETVFRSNRNVNTHRSQLVSFIKFLFKKSDIVCMLTICTHFYLVHAHFFLAHGAAVCTLFSDIENLTFSAEFYSLLPNYPQFQQLQCNNRLCQIEIKHVSGKRILIIQVYLTFVNQVIQFISNSISNSNYY